ncbi:MAG: bifunctional phosphoribosylaminoimidazolecarboxamide formyltransferase/IMP cyclohydrolase [Gammaproteobacteria bacterium]
MAAIKRALLSVSDKRGIEEFARGLSEAGVEILSTGGTARSLREAGIPVKEVSEHTGFPEIMDGRVKTLHPAIHGGLLGRRGADDAVMAEHGIAPIDLLAVNLYPFRETIAKPDCSFEEAIENIDIGGPAMVRAAAKNHASVVVVVDPGDYRRVLEALAGDAVNPALRLELAGKAYAHTAAYDASIAYWLEDREPATRLPRELPIPASRRLELRYGENPHQRGGFYTVGVPRSGTIAAAEQLQGKALSYNNIADADAALECVSHFGAPACVIVKHANPCGVATGHSLLEAYRRAYATDPVSAFGGIIAFNRPLDPETAEAILGKQFVEVIIAPALAAGTIEILERKRNLRVLVTGHRERTTTGALEYRSVSGGLLVQDADTGRLDPDQLKVVTERSPTDHEMTDLLFAWSVVRYVKSNAIVFCKDGATIGIGAGQMSRVYSTRIAAIKAADAGLAVKGSVMASDAFFPFADGVEAGAEHGITAIIQPGGSVRDPEVIEAANRHDLAMVFTGMRHFRH